MTAPAPFRVAVPDAVLADLRERLARTRWPDEIPGSAWTYGADLATVTELAAYWRDGFDWRAQEAALNAWPQFTTPIDGIDVHFVHAKGVGPSPMPLLISHGWPGSIVEFEKILPRLTDPAKFGGDPRDAFTVIAPSLPGYGFSFKPNQPRLGLKAIADVFATLMTDVLGYRRFAAQGGDWGAFVTSCLGAFHAGKLAGIHVTLLAAGRDGTPSDPPSDDERRYLEQLKHWEREETGYQWIQGTKPQTLAYGLTDSPVGLLAWILEKFRTWTDCGGDVVGHVGRDALLTNVTVYWVTGAINSSFWPYYWRRHERWPIGLDQRIAVPTAYAAFPKEILHVPRAWAERAYDIRRWTVMPRGGHFAALEAPELLAADIAEFFRPLR
ncbi:MAG: epoxide hydrolase [Candidatus Rokubacteria bacterium]|nr:epoxide hydrolase [Candidatus Rokubacteria bacterium]